MKTPTQLLIEKWEKHKSSLILLRDNTRNEDYLTINESEKQITYIDIFLTDLRALLAAEQKEIEEAYREGGVRVACDILDNNKNTPTPQDYFKTTYKNESK